MQNSNNFNHEFLRDLKGLEDILLFKSGMLWMVYQDMTDVTDTIADFDTGPIQYGIYERDHIPFLLLKFGELTFDFDVNAFDLITQIERRRLKNYTGKACFIMVEKKRDRVLVEREFQFNPHFVVHLKSCLQMQRKYYHNQASVVKKIKELTVLLVTKKMFEETKIYESPAIKEPKENAKENIGED